MTTIPATPTLPASWQPTAAGCLSTGDFWKWDYGSDQDARVVLGGPSQTTNCLPTAWASDVVYSGSECPLYYTPACTRNESLNAVTCCPSYVLLFKVDRLCVFEKSLTGHFFRPHSIYGFQCMYSIPTEYHGSQFRCVSAWATSGTFALKHTNFVANTLTVETGTAQTSRHLFALAIIYVTSVCWRGCIVPLVPLRRLMIHMADF